MSATGPIHGEGRKGPSDKRGGSYRVLRQEESGFATTSTASRRIWTTVPVRLALQADRCYRDSVNVLRRCCCCAFSYSRLNQFSEETLCPFHKRQPVRKAGFQ